jgi:NAD(P)-dependent dehydrogenase (short-subunit alcohol dehydrogenase family)
MLNTDLRGQVALVSGAGSEAGIGMAIARRLGAAGARVGMNLGLALEDARQGITVNNVAPAKRRRRLHFWHRLTPVTSRGKSSWWMAGTV